MVVSIFFSIIPKVSSATLEAGAPLAIEAFGACLGAWGFADRAFLGFRVQGLGFRVQGLGFRVRV